MVSCKRVGVFFLVFLGLSVSDHGLFDFLLF